MAICQVFFFWLSFCDERTIVNGIFGIKAYHSYYFKSIELKRVLVVSHSLFRKSRCMLLVQLAKSTVAAPKMAILLLYIGDHNAYK